VDKEQYLKRIGYSGDIYPNIELLSELQKAHLFNVPFENLDIHNKRTINLDIYEIYKKVVENNRGGFCYELNGLFHELLISLNFNAKRISARVYSKEGNYSPEFDHLAIIVKIGNFEYLSDVGFGEFSIKPIKLELGKIQSDERMNYIIKKHDEDGFQVNRIEGGKIIPEYIFKNIARHFSDFNEMCTYHQTSSNSSFMKKRLISIATENGRITITGKILKIKQNDLVIEKKLKNEMEFKEELWNRFNIKL
jgi:N-hydroxyarylamine O-acetyltransferase